MARASLAAAAQTAAQALAVVREEVARARDERLRQLTAQVDLAVNDIRAATDRETAARRERRAAYEQERAQAAAAIVDDAVAICVAIMRGETQGALR